MESGSERIKNPVEAKLASWKSGPVVLASGSSYKLAGLRAIGMAHAEANLAPEEVETKLFAEFENNQGLMDERIAEMVARAKVEYVVAQGVPDDALVCGFDTVAFMTERKGGERVRNYLQKPETREEAHAQLTNFFMHLAEEKHDFDTRTASMDALLEGNSRQQEVRNSMEVGNPEALILATTGMAVRLPGAGTHIETSHSTVRLKPNAIYAFAGSNEEDLRRRCEELAEEALVIMDDGERWKHITTGIDYSDPQIVGLLDLEEVPVLLGMPIAETGVLRGMPKDGFEKFLKALAKVG